jgi:hypothetical protein
MVLHNLRELPKRSSKDYKLVSFKGRSRGSSGYGLDDRGSIPDRGRFFF